MLEFPVLTRFAMQRHRPLLAVVLLSTLVASNSAVQVKPDDIDLRYRRTLNETQIEQVSNELAKDAMLFEHLDRAILWSRLGDLWWKADAERGRGFLLRAIEDLEAAAAKSTSERLPESDRKQLINTIRVVMRIVAARDQKLGDGLLASLSTLTTERKENSLSENSSYMADALVEAALQVVSENPARAAQLGSLSLRQGGGSQFNSLLIGLRERDGKLADALFNEALTTAQGSQNMNLFSSLLFATFTANYNPSIKALPPSPQLRAKLLNAIIKGVIQADIVSKQPDCGYAFLIGPVLTEVNQFAPQHAAAVRNAVGKCKSVVPGSEAALRNQPLKTVEEFLSAAGSAESVGLRVLFLSRAIQAAARSGKFDLAISILDGMSREEREVMGDAWDPIRVQYAKFAGLQSYEKEDFAGMERIINAVPHELQAFAALYIAEAIIAKNTDKNAVALDLLAKARRSFEKLENPDFNTFYPYMSLVRAYGKVAPQDAYGVFREAVKSINRATRVLKENTDPSEQIARGQFEPLDIPSELVQLSAFDLISIASSVESAALRTRLRLSLLSSLLAYRQVLQKTPERPASKRKGAQ